MATAPLGQSLLLDPLYLGPEWDLRRTAMEDDNTKAVQMYLNVLRGTNVSRLPSGTLAQAEELLPSLTITTSFFTYGSAERRNDYFQQLQVLTAQLEVALPISGAADKPPSADQ